MNNAGEMINGRHDCGFSDVKTLFGYFLLIVGIMISLWVFMNIYRIFNDPAQIEIFRNMLPQDSGAREIMIEGRKIVLPAVILNISAYFLGTFLMFIAGTIAGFFFRSGDRNSSMAHD